MTRRRKNSLWDSLCRALLLIITLIVMIGLVLVLPLRWYSPPTTAFMYHYQKQESAEIKYQWQSLDSISPYMSIAVVAAEDQKFPHHYGFDFDSIQNALTEDRKQQRGASTITQQLAKNLYLSSERSYSRKIIEAYLTLLLEICLDKQRILELYLNVVEFGPGIYGATAASEQFFNKPAKSMTIYEAARLAAVLPNPKQMSAAKPSSYVLKRTRQIVREINNLGGVGYLEEIAASN